MYRVLLGVFSLILLMQGCIVMPNKFAAIPPGEWRAILKLQREAPITINNQETILFEEVTEGELPFNFEVVYDDPVNFHLIIRNATERIKVEEIEFGRDFENTRDTILIKLPVFESYISAIYEEDVIEGIWVDESRGNYQVPFVAFHGENYRFTELNDAPIMDISGKWEVMFGLDKEEPYAAVGTFQQEGNQVTGTFNTTTGDYRYLEGQIKENKLYLSAFDGAHAFLFEAKILPDSTMIGSFRSGIHYTTTWEAKPNPNASLEDKMEYTLLKEGYEALDFEFENTKGETVRLTDFGSKPKIIQILGSWCPNCVDETRFLVDYIEKNELKDIEIIGLAFERQKDKTKAFAGIDRFAEQLEVPYPILYAGSSDKEEAAKALPMLNKIIAFPSLIVLDGNNKVKHIHTGFAGPATGEAYETFKATFEQYIKALRVEQM